MRLHPLAAFLLLATATAVPAAQTAFPFGILCVGSEPEPVGIPNDADDTDHDTLSDELEMEYLDTNPCVKDTDKDTIVDQNDLLPKVDARIPLTLELTGIERVGPDKCDPEAGWDPYVNFLGLGIGLLASQTVVLEDWQYAPGTGTGSDGDGHDDERPDVNKHIVLKPNGGFGASTSAVAGNAISFNLLADVTWWELVGTGPSAPVKEALGLTLHTTAIMLEHDENSDEDDIALSLRPLTILAAAGEATGFSSPPSAGDCRAVIHLAWELGAIPDAPIDVAEQRKLHPSVGTFSSCANVGCGTPSSGYALAPLLAVQGAPGVGTPSVPGADECDDVLTHHYAALAMDVTEVPLCDLLQPNDHDEEGPRGDGCDGAASIGTYTVFFQSSPALGNGWQQSFGTRYAVLSTHGLMQGQPQGEPAAFQRHHVVDMTDAEPQVAATLPMSCGVSQVSLGLEAAIAKDGSGKWVEAPLPQRCAFAHPPPASSGPTGHLVSGLQFGDGAPSCFGPQQVSVVGGAWGTPGWDAYYAAVA